MNTLFDDTRQVTAAKREMNGGTALSIRQPWCWLILRPDVDDPDERRRLYEQQIIKDVENRDWNTRFRGVFYVHASKTFDRHGYLWVREHFDIPLPGPGAFRRGGVLGRVRLVQVSQEYDSPWFVGRYGFVLRDATPLPFVPVRGQLGFFVLKTL